MGWLPAMQLGLFGNPAVHLRMSLRRTRGFASPDCSGFAFIGERSVNPAKGLFCILWAFFFSVNRLFKYHKLIISNAAPFLPQNDP